LLACKLTLAYFTLAMPQWGGGEEHRIKFGFRPRVKPVLKKVYKKKKKPY